MSTLTIFDDEELVTRNVYGRTDYGIKHRLIRKPIFENEIMYVKERNPPEETIVIYRANGRLYFHSIYVIRYPYLGRSVSPDHDATLNIRHYSYYGGQTILYPDSLEFTPGNHRKGFVVVQNHYDSKIKILKGTFIGYQSIKDKDIGIIENCKGFPLDLLKDIKLQIALEELKR